MIGRVGANYSTDKRLASKLGGQTRNVDKRQRLGPLPRIQPGLCDQRGRIVSTSLRDPRQGVRQHFPSLLEHGSDDLDNQPAVL